LKKGAILQKNRGPAEIILHFFSRFPVFLGLFSSQAFAFQQQAAIQTLTKKSCPKSDGRFSVRSGICYNRCMTVVQSGRIEGCRRWTAVKRPPALHTKRFGLRNGSSAFGRRPESDAAAQPPETAIQPRPLSASTSQYKSVQVNITK
jgi:hypothetical protein